MNTVYQLLPVPAIEQPTNCMKCPSHEVINDADPTDWFCDDDKAVVCRSAADPKPDPNSKWISARHPARKVACSVRPYNLTKESDTPDWCPIRNPVAPPAINPVIGEPA